MNEWNFIMTLNTNDTRNINILKCLEILNFLKAILKNLTQFLIHCYELTKTLHQIRFGLGYYFLSLKAKTVTSSKWAQMVTDFKRFSHDKQSNKNVVKPNASSAAILDNYGHMLGGGWPSYHQMHLLLFMCPLALLSFIQLIHLWSSYHAWTGTCHVCLPLCSQSFSFLPYHLACEVSQLLTVNWPFLLLQRILQSGEGWPGFCISADTHPAESFTILFTDTGRTEEGGRWWGRVVGEGTGGQRHSSEITKRKGRKPACVPARREARLTPENACHYLHDTTFHILSATEA